MKKHAWLIGLAVALAVTILAPLASSFPDGLERVAEDHAFLDRAQDAPFQIIPDYALPGISHEALSTILAGMVGVVIVFALTYAVAWLLRRRHNVNA